MKTALFLLLFAFVGMSCDMPTNQQRVEEMKRRFPNSNIYSLQDNSTIFLVVDSSGVYEIRMGNMYNVDITLTQKYIKQ